MGILGLLQYLKNCLKERHISHYKGKTVAVDSYAWLHKIIKGPSGRELILGGPNRFRYVDDCIKRVNKIRREGVNVIMVFDGGPLPCKRQEEEHRRKRREETFQKGKQLLDNGDEAGFKKLVDAIDISPDIANRLIVELKKKDIECIVAPYEADAQLAYLSRADIADVIITEDSDLMAFGAKRMLYKLDFYTMVGVQLDLDAVRGAKEANFAWFTHCMFLTTCILSGCDYLSQINGIGLKTAQKYIGRVTTFRGFLGQLGNKASDVPQNYETRFMKAFLTFRFQRVYCPRRKMCVQLNDFSELSKSLDQVKGEQNSDRPWSQQVLNLEVMEYVVLNQLDFDFLGQKYTDELMCSIADGNVHPVTFQQFNENFADGLTFVPKMMPRTNSILNNAKQPLGRPGHKAKTTARLSHQQKGMNKFLNGVQKPIQKFDPFAFEFKSVKNGQKYEIPSKQNSNLSVPELKPVRGLMFRESEGQSEQESQPVASELASQDSVEQISMIGRVPFQTRSNLELRPVRTQMEKKCSDSLDQIADNLFRQMFSPEYLKSPLSY